MTASSGAKPVVLEPLSHVLRMAPVTTTLAPDVEPLDSYPTERADRHDATPATQSVVQHRPLAPHLVVCATFGAHRRYYVLRVQHLFRVTKLRRLKR